MKHLLLLFVFGLILSCSQQDQSQWRIEVGPPGNEFYQPPLEKSEIIPPSEELVALASKIAPQGAEMSRWRMLNKKLYEIRLETDSEEYDFRIENSGRLLELEYENNETGSDESASELVLKGTKKEVETAELPERMMATLTTINQVPDKAWKAQTIAGERFIAQSDDLVFYARPDGQIQAIGRVDAGALNEIDPNSVKEEPVIEDIAADAKKRLGPYNDRFDFQKHIAELVAEQPKGGFRFVVMGDSRSQYEMWQMIIRHIDQLDPKPKFVINSGDIVRHGYTDEYLDYYIPPLLETDIPYFVAIGNHDDGDDGMAVQYRTLFGENSLNYFFDYGPCRFIFMDNCTNVLEPPHTLAWLEDALASTPKGKKIIFAMHQPPHDIENLAWLEDALASTPKGKKIIFAMHQPPHDIEKWAYHAWDEKYSPKLTDMLQKYQVEHVFLGHIHAYSTAHHKDVDYTISGGGGAGLHDRFGPQRRRLHHLRRRRRRFARPVWPAGQRASLHHLRRSAGRHADTAGGALL